MKHTDTRPLAVHPTAAFSTGVALGRAIRKLLIWKRSPSTFVSGLESKRRQLIAASHAQIEPLAATSGEAVINSVEAAWIYAVPRFLIDFQYQALMIAGYCLRHRSFGASWHRPERVIRAPTGCRDRTLVCPGLRRRSRHPLRDRAVHHCRRNTSIAGYLRSRIMPSVLMPLRTRQSMRATAST